MKHSDARKVLDQLLAAWPSMDMPAETAQTWVRMLAELDHAAASAAADACIRSSNYFPTIARFREAMAGLGRDVSFEWTSSQSCPVCRGTTTVKDDQGRDWLCRCVAFERKPRVHNAVTAPPAELLSAAREVLDARKFSNNRPSIGDGADTGG